MGRLESVHDVSLFGHHHAAPTLLQRIGDGAAAVAHLPLAFWLTIIPVAGGLTVAYVTHRLNLSRDRLASRREDERRREDEERAATRVRADLSLRLIRHREALRAASGGDLTRLEPEHDALVRRASKTDVIDVLGKRSPCFMAVLQREEAAIAAARAGGGERPGDPAFRRTLGDLEAAFEEYATLFALSDAAQPAKTSR